MLRAVLTWVCVLLPLAGLGLGCSVQYRCRVEPPGTPAAYTHGPGRDIRYDGYGNVAGDLEVVVRTYRAPLEGGRLLLLGLPRLVDPRTGLEIARLLRDADRILHLGVAPGSGSPGKEDAVFEGVGRFLGLATLSTAEELARLPWKSCRGEASSSAVPVGEAEAADRLGEALRSLHRIGRPLLGRFPAQRFQDFLKHHYARTLVSTNGSALEGLREFTARIRQLLERARHASEQEEWNQIERLLERIGDQLTGLSTPKSLPGDDAVLSSVRAQFEGRVVPSTLGVLLDVAGATRLAARLDELGFREAEVRWIRVWRMNARVMVEGIPVPGGPSDR